MKYIIIVIALAVTCHANAGLLVNDDREVWRTVMKIMQEEHDKTKHVNVKKKTECKKLTTTKGKTK